MNKLYFVRTCLITALLFLTASVFSLSAFGKLSMTFRLQKFDKRGRRVGRKETFVLGLTPTESTYTIGSSKKCDCVVDGLAKSHIQIKLKRKKENGRMVRCVTLVKGTNSGSDGQPVYFWRSRCDSREEIYTLDPDSVEDQADKLREGSKLLKEGSLIELKMKNGGKITIEVVAIARPSDEQMKALANKGMTVVGGDTIVCGEHEKKLMTRNTKINPFSDYVGTHLEVDFSNFADVRDRLIGRIKAGEEQQGSESDAQANKKSLGNVLAFVNDLFHTYDHCTKFDRLSAHVSNGVGVARHMALSAAYCLAVLKEEGILSAGSVHRYRSKVENHAVSLYIPDSGDCALLTFYVVDPWLEVIKHYEYDTDRDKIHLIASYGNDEPREERVADKSRGFSGDLKEFETTIYQECSALLKEIREVVVEALGITMIRRNERGVSKFHTNCSSGNNEEINTALDRGFATDDPDDDGKTGLVYALEGNRPSTVLLLLNRGADCSLERLADVRISSRCAYILAVFKHGIDPNSPFSDLTFSDLTCGARDEIEQVPREVWESLWCAASNYFPIGCQRKGLDLDHFKRVWREELIEPKREVIQAYIVGNSADLQRMNEEAQKASGPSEEGEQFLDVRDQLLVIKIENSTWKSLKLLLPNENDCERLGLLTRAEKRDHQKTIDVLILGCQDKLREMVLKEQVQGEWFERLERLCPNKDECRSLLGEFESRWSIKRKNGTLVEKETWDESKKNTFRILMAGLRGEKPERVEPGLPYFFPAGPPETIPFSYVCSGDSEHEKRGKQKPGVHLTDEMRAQLARRKVAVHIGQDGISIDDTYYKFVHRHFTEFSRVPHIKAGPNTSSTVGEYVYINPKSVLLIEHYSIFKNNVLSLQQGAGFEEHVQQIAQIAVQYANEQLGGNEEKLENFIKVYRESDETIRGTAYVPLEAFLSAGLGECRHQALFIGFLLDSLMCDPDFNITGHVHVARTEILTESEGESSLHAWNVWQVRDPRTPEKVAIHIDAAYHQLAYFLRIEEDGVLYREAREELNKVYQDGGNVADMNLLALQGKKEENS